MGPELNSLVLPNANAFELDEICNQYGNIRRKLTYIEFQKGFLSSDDIIEIYKKWRDTHEYFILEETYSDVEPIRYDRVRGVFVGGVVDKHKYHFVKAAKRGNDVYKHAVKRKFKDLDGLDPIIFFDESHSGLGKTPMLFITLTIDAKTISLEDAWLDIGKRLNRFYSALQKEYGKISKIRVWESHNSGYPHVHLTVFFKDYCFPVFKHRNTFRIANSHRDKMSGFWHGFVDIQAISDTLGAFHEVKKYITEDIFSDKANKTNAMCWLFGNQQYAVSHDFVECVWGYKGVDISEPTPFDLVIPIMANSNQKDDRCRFVGILGGHQLEFNSEIWHYTITDPPPRVRELLEKEELRQNELRLYRMKKEGVYCPPGETYDD